MNFVRESHPFIRVSLLGLFVCFLAMIGPATVAQDAVPMSRQHGKAPDCVILLHGLGRTFLSMWPMEHALSKAGFVTVNIDYPSRKASIESLAREFIPQGIRRCDGEGAARVHFVTHSMGGILARSFLSEYRPPNLGRVVMLGPPSQGSEAADLLKDEAWYQWLNGPAGQQLVTGPAGLPGRLGPVDYPVGVIAGNRHAFYDGWLAETIPGPDDGKVSIERAKVAGMADFRVVPETHSFIMNADEVIAQTIHFLRNGVFFR